MHPVIGKEGLIVSWFKKGNREDSGNYRGINLFECGR